MKSPSRTTRLIFALASAAAVASLHAGCSSDESLFGDGRQNDGGPGGPGLGGGGGDGSVETFTTIVIAPLDVVLDVDLDAKTPVTEYTAKGIRADGTEVAITGAWDYAKADAANFEQNKLVPTGFVGGTGDVTFRYGTQSATTTATFRMKMSVGTPPDAAVQTAFTNASVADPALNVIYPYDKTVFPRGLPSPALQWTGGGASDVYKIVAKSATFELTEYTTAPPPATHPFPSAPVDTWAKLTDSTVGDVTLSIQRWDGTTAYLPKTQTFKVAGGNLKGTVYYTRLKAGDSFVRRLEMGKTAESFLDGTGVACIACHSVSRDGSRIAASVNGGASPWATFDTVTGAKLYQSAQPSGFQAISPNGSHVIWRHWKDGSFGTDNKLLLSTYDSDAVLAELPVPTGGPSHPVWSPDGSKIAYAIRTAGNGLNYTASTLWTTDVDLQTPGFGSPVKIVDPDATYPVVANPTYSPDAKWIGFMRANQSRSDGPDPRAELWVTSSDGATKIRLDQANGVPVLGATPTKSWGPSFHPIAAGGYFWVAFFSSRPYGHTTFTTQRQIWIAAVSANPTAGQDPSFPAFYITGQDQDSYNERPQFTVNPCKPLGQTCENGYDCCDGYCRKDANGQLVCQQKGNECAKSGEKCTTDGDCCNGLGCIGGFCAASGPK